MTTEPPNLKPLRPRLTIAPEEPAPVMYTPIEEKVHKLTFSDGLNFGCGFWVAGFLFTVVAVPAISLLVGLMITILGGTLAGLGR